ncbi:MAG: 2OG-Fe(II) oxygenase [Ramlibacter sp.]|nr:2OG-Fe(II) oxygenase [Ramlibacter sp.]
MLLHVRNVLTAAEVAGARGVLAAAPWGEGRLTAGEQAALAKHNHQLPEACEAAQQLQQVVLRGLERNALFFSATLPKQISPPLFNRYGGAADRFDDHVDSAVRYLRNGAGRVRTDISCTLFLTEPEDYEGGELVINDVSGEKRVKLPAGDMVIYPGTSVHRVEPVTRGYRTASFFWIQSMVRSDEQRRLLFDMDAHLRSLRGTVGETQPAVVGLTGTYHNLLRLWADV